MNIRFNEAGSFLYTAKNSTVLFRREYLKKSPQKEKTVLIIYYLKFLKYFFS